MDRATDFYYVFRWRQEVRTASWLNSPQSHIPTGGTNTFTPNNPFDCLNRPFKKDGLSFLEIKPPRAVDQLLPRVIATGRTGAGKWLAVIGMETKVHCARRGAMDFLFNLTKRTPRLAE